MQKPVENSEGSFALYCVIAEEAIATSRREDRDESFGNITEWFKTLCGQRHLTYNGELSVKAIDAVQANQSRKAAS